MNGKWMFRLWMIAGVLGGMCWTVSAAPPWGELISLRSIDADPNNAYMLTEENGPWMVMACSFSGDGAQKQAKELVYELRKRYKLPAYTYEGHFDPGEAQGRGIDEFGKPKKFTYQKYKDSKDKAKARRPELIEVAVLVGNYQAADDADTQKTLQKVKYATPQCLEVKEGTPTHQTLTGWRMLQRQVYEAIGSDKKKLGSMGHAFITTNPLLPSDYFAPKNGLDEVVVALNKGVPYSLLDCPGKYTVRVATFKGRAVIKQDEIKEIQSGNKEMKSELAEAAKKADILTRALRIKGYEAYQFHDRYASIVTVGSFSSMGTPQANGTMNFSPEVRRVVEVFGVDPNATEKLEPEVQGVLKASGLGEYARAMPVKFIKIENNKIPFDVQPVPVEVPKQSISMALRGRE